MAEVDVERLTKETIKDGGVLALLYFDMHGKERDQLVQLGTGFVQKLIAEEGVVYAVGEIDEPMEQGGMWATSLEVKLLTRDFGSLGRLCSMYSPFSLEVLKPEEVRMGVSEAQELLMGMSTSAYELKKIIFEKSSNAEDREKFQRGLKARAEAGKRLLEKKKE